MKNPDVKFAEEKIIIYVKATVNVRESYEDTIMIELGENDKDNTIDITSCLMPNEDQNECEEYLKNTINGMIEDAYEQLGEDEDEDGRYGITKCEKERDEIEIEINVLINFQNNQIYLQDGTEMLNITDYLSTDRTSDIFHKYELATK